MLILTNSAFNNKNSSPFTNAKFERKASGYILIGGIEVASTLQCCHCNGHFVSIRGSGTVRGFCLNCKKTTCGKKECDPCFPFEKKLDVSEKNNRFL